MRLNHLSRGALLTASVVFALVGCSSVNLDEQPAAPIVDSSATTDTKTGPDPRAVASVDAQAGRALDPLNDPNNPLSKRSIFFDFDSFVVKSEYQPIVQTHGSYLGTNKQRRVTVEGHTDERGGREYNLALGQKRAEAVKQRLLCWVWLTPKWKRSALVRKSHAEQVRVKMRGRKIAGQT